jgi:hypothetical protein
LATGGHCLALQRDNLTEFRCRQHEDWCLATLADLVGLCPSLPLDYCRLGWDPPRCQEEGVCVAERRRGGPRSSSTQYRAELSTANAAPAWFHSWHEQVILVAASRPAPTARKVMQRPQRTVVKRKHSRLLSSKRGLWPFSCQESATWERLPAWNGIAPTGYRVVSPSQMWLGSSTVTGNARQAAEARGLPPRLVGTVRPLQHHGKISRLVGSGASPPRPRRPRGNRHVYANGAPLWEKHTLGGEVTVQQRRPSAHTLYHEHPRWGAGDGGPPHGRGRTWLAWLALDSLPT